MRKLLIFVLVLAIGMFAISCKKGGSDTPTGPVAENPTPTSTPTPNFSETPSATFTPILFTPTPTPTTTPSSETMSVEYLAYGVSGVTITGEYTGAGGASVTITETTLPYTSPLVDVPVNRDVTFCIRAEGVTVGQVFNLDVYKNGSLTALSGPQTSTVSGIVFLCQWGSI